MNTKGTNKRLAEKQSTFFGKNRRQKLTRKRRNFIQTDIPKATAEKSKTILAIAAILTGVLWVTSVFAIAVSLQFPV